VNIIEYVERLERVKRWLVVLCVVNGVLCLINAWLLWQLD
jgi:hypothetical protein